MRRHLNKKNSVIDSCGSFELLDIFPSKSKVSIGVSNSRRIQRVVNNGEQDGWPDIEENVAGKSSRNFFSTPSVSLHVSLLSVSLYNKRLSNLESY